MQTGHYYENFLLVTGTTTVCDTKRPQTSTLKTSHRVCVIPAREKAHRAQVEVSAAAANGSLSDTLDRVSALNEN